MRPALAHDDAFELLDAVAMDVSDPIERDAGLAHVAQCDICRRELAILRETVSELAFAAPIAADAESGTRERIHSRLMDRVSADTRSRGVIPLRPAEAAPTSMPTEQKARERVIDTLAWRRAEWVALAASVMLVVSIGLLAATFRDREHMRDALTTELARG